VQILFYVYFTIKRVAGVAAERNSLAVPTLPNLTFPQKHVILRLFDSRHLAARFAVRMNTVNGYVTDSAFGRKVVGEQIPLTAGAELVEDGIEDFSEVGGFCGSASGQDDQGSEEFPLSVGQVGAIGNRSIPF
jgi:hypothetical protein